MSNTTPPTFIQIPPPEPQQTFDPRGVIEAARGVVTEKDNGFAPLTPLNPQKQYEDLIKHLGDQQQRLDRSPVDPANRISELVTKNNGLETKNDDLAKLRKDDLEKYLKDRSTDLVEYHNRRISELEGHHNAVLRLKDDKITELQTRVTSLKEAKKHLEDQHKADIEQRMIDMQHYHAEVLRLTREVSEARLERLEDERRRLTDGWTKLDVAKGSLDEERKTWMDKLIATAKDFKIAKFFK